MIVDSTMSRKTIWSRPIVCVTMRDVIHEEGCCNCHRDHTHAELILLVSGLNKFSMVVNYDLRGRSVEVYHFPFLGRLLK